MSDLNLRQVHLAAGAAYADELFLELARADADPDLHAAALAASLDVGIAAMLDGVAAVNRHHGVDGAAASDMEAAALQGFSRRWSTLCSGGGGRA